MYQLILSTIESFKIICGFVISITNIIYLYFINQLLNIQWTKINQSSVWYLLQYFVYFLKIVYVF